MQCYRNLPTKLSSRKRENVNVTHRLESICKYELIVFVVTVNQLMASARVLKRVWEKHKREEKLYVIEHPKYHDRVVLLSWAISLNRTTENREGKARKYTIVEIARRRRHIINTVKQEEKREKRTLERNSRTDDFLLGHPISLRS